MVVNRWIQDESADIINSNKTDNRVLGIESTEGNKVIEKIFLWFRRKASTNFGVATSLTIDLGITIGAILDSIVFLN